MPVDRARPAGDAGPARHRLRRSARRAAVVAGIALFGAAVALATLGATSATSGDVGPGTVEVRASAARSGRTRLSLPPLGAVTAATHRAPLALDAEVERLDLDALQRLLGADDPRRALEAEVEADLGPLLRRMARRALLVAALTGAVAAALLPGRRLRHLPAGAVGGAAAVSLLLGATWQGYDTARFEEPRFDGSLARAPDVLRTVGRHVEDLAAVREKVSVLGGELSALYQALAEPAGPPPGDVRILHVSDIHLNPLGLEITRQLAERFAVEAVVDTGDLTSFGYPVEARIADLLVGMPVPYLLVPGNHDSPEVRAALAGMDGVTVLDGTADVGGVRVLGVPDPTFTADNAVGPREAEADKRRRAAGVGRRVDADDPDVLAVHDPVLASRASGRVPLVVSGHVHKRGNRVEDGTRFLTVGSTGATGLGTFTVEGGRAYEAQVLTFRDRRLTGIDYVSIRGIGGSFRVDRVVIPAPADDAAADPAAAATTTTTTTEAAPPG
ncbi:MAG TPA: metallophosphoesterase [Acidimicrobiales bacterium]|nr:metallophosphoesterase [Acidimicrobiales bacterium]